MPTTAGLTYKDYQFLPETGPRYQLINGDLFMAPAPNRHHQRISRNLQFILTEYLKQNPTGELYNAPFDVILSDVDVFQPDLVFLTNEHLDRFIDEGLEGTPDFVVEILSPRTAELDRHTKPTQYAKFGVQELWIIEPETRRVLVYHLQKRAEHPVSVYEDDEFIECVFFPGLKISTAKIFAERIRDL
jgi:Uma2 family endonuclease